jgi:hypothetical protein
MVWMVWVFRFPVVSTATAVLRGARWNRTDIHDVSLLANVAHPMRHEPASAVRW